jgi:hypothetical protein
MQGKREEKENNLVNTGLSPQRNGHLVHKTTPSILSLLEIAWTIKSVVLEPLKENIQIIAKQGRKVTHWLWVIYLTWADW